MKYACTYVYCTAYQQKNFYEKNVVFNLDAFKSVIGPVVWCVHVRTNGFMPKNV